jgi:hypothetical protein
MAATYDSIETVTLTNNTTQEVIFNSFGSGYTDLRIVFKGGASAATTEFQGQFNSDTTNLYSRTRITNDGSVSASSSRADTVSFMRFTGVGYLPNQDLTGVTVIDVIGYSNATRYKTVLSRHGVWTQETNAMINLWRNTSAITSIRLFTQANYFYSGSMFTLYGIKAA